MKEVAQSAAETDGSDDFKTAVAEMRSAVDALPAELIVEARSLRYPQLHHACVEGNLALIKALLAAGLSPDFYPCTDDEDDLTSLGWVARDEEMDFGTKVAVAELLLASGADPGEGDPLEQAEMAGDEEFETFLLNAINAYQQLI